MSHSPNQRWQSRSPARRGVYINEQLNKKQKNTTFHSPYKDGRPNKDYINPSFISSHLFYPRDIADNASVTLQNNYAHNENDSRKQQLYRQRMRTEMQERERSNPKEGNHRQRDFRHQRNAVPNKILRINEPEKLLTNQLQSLQDYRENLEQHRSSNKNRQQQDIPPYFQKQRRDNSSDIVRQAQNQAEMSNWMALTSELKEIKKELQRANQVIEKERSQRQTEEHLSRQKSQDLRQKKEADLLAGILKEQIRVNQLRKDRRWNF